MPLDIPKTKQIKGRLCRNCSGPIEKTTGNNQRKKIFCQENCRKEFHKNSGISVYRLKTQVQLWVRQEVRAELVRLGISKIQSLAVPVGADLGNGSARRKS